MPNTSNRTRICHVQLKRTHAQKTSSQLTAFPLSNELNSVNSTLIERLSENQLKFGRGVFRSRTNQTILSGLLLELYVLTQFLCTDRGDVSGPAGLAKAGPLFRGSLVSFSDCRDSLRTRRLGEVSHASSPLPCVYALLVIVHALLPADQEPGAARMDCISTHTF